MMVESLWKRLHCAGLISNEEDKAWSKFQGTAAKDVVYAAVEEML
jgi:hypothetical protein